MPLTWMEVVINAAGKCINNDSSRTRPTRTYACVITSMDGGNFCANVMQDLPPSVLLSYHLKTNQYDATAGE